MDTISVGETVSTSSTTRLDYSLALKRGQTVMIELEADYEAYLEIYNRYDELVMSGEGIRDRTPMLSFTSPDPEDFVIRVRSHYGEVESGFTLSVREYEHPKITVGEIVSTTSESYAAYSLTLDEGQTVIIDLQADWDPCLEIYENMMLIASDDDSGGNMNSRLTLTALNPGDFVIRVRSYCSGMAQGAFTLSVREYEYPKATITVGETVSATSETYVAYSLTLDEGQTVKIDLQAVEWDAYLRIFGNGELLASDDDSGGGTNSLLTFTAPSSGDFVIRVSSYASAIAKGAFTLSVSE